MSWQCSTPSIRRQLYANCQQIKLSSYSARLRPVGSWASDAFNQCKVFLERHIWNYATCIGIGAAPLASAPASAFDSATETMWQILVTRSCFVPHILYAGIYLSIYLSSPCLVAAVSALFCSSSSLSLTVSSGYNGKQPATLSHRVVGSHRGVAKGREREGGGLHEYFNGKLHCFRFIWVWKIYANEVWQIAKLDMLLKLVMSLNLTTLLKEEHDSY